MLPITSDPAPPQRAPPLMASLLGAPTPLPLQEPPRGEKILFPPPPKKTAMQKILGRPSSSYGSSVGGEEEEEEKSKGGGSVAAAVVETESVDRAEDADVSPSKGEEDMLGADVIVKSIRRMIMKRQEQLRLPFFCTYMVLVTISMLINDLPAAGPSATGYYRNQGLDTDVDSEAFEKITTKTELWDWVEGQIPTLFPKSANDADRSPNQPMGYVILRQFRVKRSEAESKPMQVLPLSIRNRMRAERIPAFSTETMAEDDYVPQTTDPNDATLLGGNMYPWKNNAQRTGVADGAPISGLLFDYVQPDAAYSLYFAVSDNFDTPKSGRKAKDQLARLGPKGLNWIDGNTRAVLVDLLTFNAVEGTFATSTLLVEIAPQGVYLTSVTHSPFRNMDRAQPKDAFLFFLDVAALLCVVLEVFVFFFTVWSAESQGQHLGELFGFWFFVMFVWVIVFATLTATRFQVWFPERGNYSGADGKMQFLDDFIAHGAAARSAKIRVAVLNIISWLRIFSFLQAAGGSSVLTDTISGSVWYLFAWVVTFVLIFFPYVVTGYILYGHTLVDFSTLMRSAMTLFFMISKGTIDNFLEMKTMYPIWTQTYFFTYLILEWLVMLNMFIAIITGTFAFVQSSRISSNKADLATRAAGKLRKVILSISTRYNRMTSRKSKKAASAPQKKKRPDRLQSSRWPKSIIDMTARQHGAIAKVRAMTTDETGKEDMESVRLSREQSYEKLDGLLTHQEIDKIYERAHRETQASDSMKVVSERWTITTQKRVENVSHLKDMLALLGNRLGVPRDTPPPATSKLPPRSEHTPQRLCSNSVKAHERLRVLSEEATAISTSFKNPVLKTLREDIGYVADAEAHTRRIAPNTADGETSHNSIDTLIQEMKSLLFLQGEEKKRTPHDNSLLVAKGLNDIFEKQKENFENTTNFQMWGLSRRQYDTQVY